MRTTPPLPAWITGFKPTLANCQNVYQILKGETKLFGTEALTDESGAPDASWTYGDWDAEMLLLAQDPCDAETVKARLAAGHPDPYCALDWRNFADGMETNRNLHWLAQQIGCRKLYGSAYVGLLKGGGRGGAVPRSMELRTYIQRVLRWVLEPAQTRNLKTVACLGTVARDSMIQILNLDQSRATTLRRGVGSSVCVGRLRVVHLMHPGRRNLGKGGCGPEAWTHWRRFAVDSGYPVLPAPWLWSR